MQKISKVVPQNLEAERALLGSILLDNEVLSQFRGMIKAEDFFSEAHRIVFRSMVALSLKDQAIDIVTVTEDVCRQGLLAKAGGEAYIASLTDGVPIGATSAVADYIRLVREKSVSREIIAASENLISRCLDGDVDAVSLATDYYAQLECLRSTRPADSDNPRPDRDVILETLAEMDSEDGLRVMSGLRGLDDLTGGFRAGELVIITGEPGMGKTIFARQIARNACKNGLHGLFVSGEMMAGHLLLRDLSAMTGISIRLLRNPKAMTPQEFHQLPGRVNSFCDCCRIMDGNLKVADLYRAAALVRSCGMLKWMVVDYDELIEGEGADALEKQTSVVTRCKHLSMKHHIPVFLISQLRKAMDDKDRNLPTLARLYGTGAKAKHASTVIYIDRKWVRKFEGNEADATVTLLKHRDGRVGKIDARFDIAHYKYVDREEAV